MSDTTAETTNKAVPVRLQRKRTKGFSLAAASERANGLECRYVGRGSEWRNRFKIVPKERKFFVIDVQNGDLWLFVYDTKKEAQQSVKDAFTGILESYKPAIRHQLAGFNLACWCALCPKHAETGLPLGEKCPDCDPCHADTLLEIANPALLAKLGEEPTP